MSIGGGLALFGWGALRLFGLLRAQVIFRAAVGPVWEGVAAIVAVLLAVVLLTGAGEPVTLTRWLTIAVCEFLLGSLLGAVLSLPGAALLGATGQSTVTLHASRSSALPLLLAVACVSGGLVAGIHRPLLLALRAWFVVWPVGMPARWLPALPELLPWTITAAHNGLVLALTLATPVLLTSATLDLGLRLASRGLAVPVSEALRPWLCSAAAMISLGAAWAVYPTAWLRAWPV